MTRSRDTASIIPTVDAKGDLLVGTADNAIDNLSPGTNGQVLTANSATATGLEWKTVSATAPVTYNSTTQEVGFDQSRLGGTTNAIINGAFDIWQRGVTFTSVTAGTYFADRFLTQINVNANAQTITRVTDAPTGFTYAARVQRSAAVFSGIAQRIESLASSSMIGQQVTVSFWAKTPEAGQTVRAQLLYPSAVDNFATTTLFETVTNTITSSWTRYTATFSSLTASFTNGLELRLGTNSSGSATHDFYVTGVQMEVGTVATPFRRNANSIQAELAACQRYFYRRERVGGNAYPVNLGFYNTGTQLLIGHIHPVEMRAPATLSFSALADFDIEPFDAAPSAISLVGSSTTYGCEMQVTDPTSRSVGQVGTIAIDTDGAWLAFDAEL
jgi:hypothetical protein